MTQRDFERLRFERPDLRFPPFEELLNVHQLKILSWARDRVIAERASVVLRFAGSYIPAHDSLPYYDPQEMESPTKAKA